MRFFHRRFHGRVKLIIGDLADLFVSQRLKEVLHFLTERAHEFRKCHSKHCSLFSQLLSLFILLFLKLLTDRFLEFCANLFLYLAASCFNLVISSLLCFLKKFILAGSLALRLDSLNL